MNDRLIVDPSVVVRLQTPEEASNYLEERIEEVRLMIRQRPPPPSDEITSVEYLLWERRVMLLHGQALGSLLFAQAFGHLTPERFKLLKGSLLAAMLLRTSEVQLGENR